jgi:hypothetical protein
VSYWVERDARVKRLNRAKGDETMVMRWMRAVTAMAVLLTMAGCEGTPTAVEEVHVDPELRVMEAFTVALGEFDGAAAASLPPATGPYLGRLLRLAHHTVVTEQGPDAAAEVFAPLRALYREAAEARRAGDRERFLAKAREAHELTARIVVEVLGPDVVTQVLERADVAIARLRSRIAEAQAAGKDVSRFLAIAEHAERLLAAAAAAFRAGRPALALDLGTRALEVAMLHGPAAGPSRR